MSLSKRNYSCTTSNNCNQYLKPVRCKPGGPVLASQKGYIILLSPFCVRQNRVCLRNKLKHNACTSCLSFSCCLVRMILQSKLPACQSRHNEPTSLLVMLSVTACRSAMLDVLISIQFADLSGQVVYWATHFVLLVNPEDNSATTKSSYRWLSCHL